MSTEHTSTRAGLIGDVSFAVGATVVPVLAAGPLWLLTAFISAACLGTRSGSRSAILAAYAAPAALGAPWPTHCLAASAMWFLTARCSDPGITSLLRRRTTWAKLIAVPGLVALGAAAGGVVVVIDRTRIFDAGFVFDMRPPSPAMLTAVVICLALVNAIAEEIFWREVVDQTLSEGSACRRYMFQVVTFGLGHWNGVPNGPVGALASGTFSAIIYRVRERWGLVAGIVVHLAADLVIFWFVAQHAVFAWTGFHWTPVP